MAKKKYDFAGWATKANMKCTDGRTIMTGASCRSSFLVRQIQDNVR